MNEEINKAITEERQRIADAIEALVITKEISSDWYAAGIKTRLVCSIIARNGLTAEKVSEMKEE